MNSVQPEKPALLIIDMVKDNFVEEHKLPITAQAKQIIAPTNALIAFFRRQNWPVVFSTDAFHEADFFFTGRMRPHSLAGTAGAEVVETLDHKPEDYWLPKPRLSAFFKTGLETWLAEREVTMCVVGGIATNFCVLTTAMDALCHDFKAVLLEDCAAAFTPEVHEHTLGLYRRNALWPLFQVLTSTQLMAQLSGEKQ